MKIRALIVSALMICCVSATILYTRAAQLPDESKLITEAIQGKNTPQLIKALITKMKNQLEVNEDTFPELIKEVEEYTATCDDPASAALLHSMVAEMYNRFYSLNRWQINQRTDLAGYVPEDIREWTQNLFTQKIKQELTASLEPAQLLQKTPVSEYKALLETGKDTPSLRPTLYDFLAYRALEIQPTQEIYQSLIGWLNTQSDKQALLLAELDFLKFKYTRLYDENTQKKYLSSLDSLLSLYSNNDFSVEIVNEKLNLMSNRIYSYNPGQERDSLNAAIYQLCTATIARFPKYNRIGLIKNRLDELQAPNIQVTGDNNVYPGKELSLKLKYKNISQLTVNFYKSLKTPQQTSYYFNNDTVKSLGALVKKVEVKLKHPNTYSELDTTLTIPMNDLGLYEYVITVPGTQIQTKNIFSVSRLAAISRNMPSGETEILVTDYLSGKPLPDATVDYYYGKRQNLQKQGSVKTDRDGLATFPRKNDMMGFLATKGDDRHSMLTLVYPDGLGVPQNLKARPQLALFTDRGLYRPGQTLYFKGIAYMNDTNNPYAVEGESFKITLRDANWKEVTTKTFKTNKFGSFNGEFTLPRQTLNGMFTLSSEYASTSIRVEEYKRPSFFVELLPIKGDITFGDQVTIEGKAQTFSGVSLQNGELTYRITKRPFWLRGYFGNNSTEQVAEGKTNIDNNGTFSFSFRPEKTNSGFNFFPYQSYEVTATLTDSNGETQVGTSVFSVGESSILLRTDLTKKIEKDSVNAIVYAETLNGEKLTINGNYTICVLEGEEKTIPYNYQQHEYKEGKQVASGSFTSGKAIDKNIFVILPSGRYRINLEAKDSKGRTATSHQDFILYSKQDKRPPVFTHIWLLEEKTTCLPGEEARIVFGTSDKDAHILYELYQDGKCISRKRHVLSDKNETFRIPFLESYGDGVVASFTFVKEGQLYYTQVAVKRQQPDRSLTIKPETFRDRLLPGSQETWKFRILNADSLPVAAEVLASMYDASLDKILPFQWYFNPERTTYLYASSFIGGISLDHRTLQDAANSKYMNIPEFQYDRLNWQGIMDFPRNYRGNRASEGGVMMKSAAPEMAVAEAQVATYSMQDNATVTGGVLKENRIFTVAQEAGEGNRESSNPIVQMRENFNETAFFYPSLVTNAEGDVILQFTMPESNTTWKLQTLANTTDMKHGLLTKEVITSKPLMVLPNLPRFMRQGDEISISTQVINNSKETINGRVSLELFDPANNQPVICLTKSQKAFTLTADSITTVSWTFRVPTTTNLIGCRIVADSDSGSDGEQHLIPVLSNQILITESTPFYLMGDGEKRIQLPGSTGNRKPFRMTLELTANPIWYAVQALPTITQPENDNVISWFASYYSNILADHIASANPKIQQVIKQWTAQGGTAETLYSNLEKNQELKNILLQETPWVMAAENETEQKQRLSLLFDLNRASQQRDQALQRLLELQDEEGGWSWFKGFQPSREITLFILKGMHQLVEMNAIQYGQQEKEMQMKALNYLDKQMQLNYERLQKNSKNWQNSEPSPTQIEFLFVRSAYRDIPELGSARDAIRFYTAQAEKQWSKQSLYGKGEIALLMHRNGKKEVANDILAWLRKTATSSAEQGMYWANNRSGNDFFISPIDTHCLLMNVFNTLAPDQSETDRLKQWLLNQKRTQNWESVPATVNAIYALLLSGSDWLNNNNTCIVKWGNKTYSTTDGETATGYLKVMVSDEKTIASERNSISIRKEGKTPAWGAVYEQYFENIDQIQKQKGVLNVEKKLFIESNSGSGLLIEPVTEQRPLQIGDKVIVRLTIRSDRAMDYVFLKDLRAGCFEPANQLSGTQFRDGTVFYQSPTDVSENFFFSHLAEGTFVIEYPVYVTRCGEYAGGISTIQCLYAPEFVSHTEGGKIRVD